MNYGEFEQRFPVLLSVVRDVAYDNQVSIDTGLPFEHEGFAAMEEELAKLTQEERKTFAMGEVSEVEAIAGRHPALLACHEWLDLEFNGDFGSVGIFC